jgi:EAL domain-containing protein (putative c-di-GMP-specific phosphodiesterase class I)
MSVDRFDEWVQNAVETAEEQKNAFFTLANISFEDFFNASHPAKMEILKNLGQEKSLQTMDLYFEIIETINELEEQLREIERQ